MFEEIVIPELNEDQHVIIKDNNNGETFCIRALLNEIIKFLNMILKMEF